MSSTSSAESAASRSDSSARECKRSPSVKKIHTAAECSRSIGRKSKSTVTCESSQASAWPQMELLPTSCAEDSLAKKSHALETEKDCAAHARAYGQSSPEFLARFDHATRSWRTSQLCLIEGLTKYSESWPRSGMIRSGIAYRLAPLEPDTFETEFGFWPTPQHRDHRSGRGWSPNVRKGGWMLTEAVYENERLSSERIGLQRGELPLSKTRGMLSPKWVEWLMGFPIGFTELKPSATRLSRKSLKSLAER